MAAVSTIPVGLQEWIGQNPTRAVVLLTRLKRNEAKEPVRTLAREASIRQTEAAAFLGALDDDLYEALLAQSREAAGTRREHAVARLRAGGTSEREAAPERLKIGPHHGIDRRWLDPFPGETKPIEEIPKPPAYTSPLGAVHSRLQAEVERTSSSASFTPDVNSQSPAEADAASEAFEAFEEYAANLRDNGVEITGDLKEELVRELVERASANLAGQGVRHVVRLTRSGQFRIEIDSKGRHPLNRLARRLRKLCNGLQLFYLPSLLLAQGFSAAFMPDYNLILLGDRDLLEPRASILLQHEIRHAFRHHALAKRQPSPYYGSIEGKKGRLLDVVTNTYQSRQSVDEMDTYTLTLRQGLGKVRRALAQEKFDLEDYPGMVDVIQHGLEVSLRNISTARLALANLEKGGLSGWAIDGGIVRASVPTGQGRAPITIPLIESSGIDDPENDRLLEAQLEWLITAGKAHLAQFRLAQKLWDRVNDASDPGEQALLVEAFLRVLRSGRRAKVPDRSFEALAEAFNAAVDALWSKAAG